MLSRVWIATAERRFFFSISRRMPTANRRGPVSTRRYLQTRLARALSDATLRFDLVPGRSPSACAERLLKNGSVLQPSTHRRTVTAAAPSTPPVPSTLRRVPTAKAEDLRRSKRSRPRPRRCLPPNLTPPHWAVAVGTHRGVAVYINRYGDRRRRNGDQRGIPSPSIRPWQDLFLITFRHMPTANARGRDRIGGVASGRAGGEARL